MIILVVILILVAIVVIWVIQHKYEVQPEDSSDQFNYDVKVIKDTIMADAILHRGLMIEIINGPCLTCVTGNSSSTEGRSDIITFNKMIDAEPNMRKALIRYFGGGMSLKITALLRHRNEIIRDYYQHLRNSFCSNSDHSIEINTSTPNDSDMITTTLHQLHSISNEITNGFATTFNASPETSDVISSKCRRLFNLLTMYDKELINQAKLYLQKQYNISMNCSQSALELSHRISSEIQEFMKHSRQKLLTL